MSSKSSGSDLGSDLYSGAASYGKFQSTVSLVISCIIALFLIYFGVKFLINPTVHSGSATASIISADCTRSVDNNGNITYGCTLNITFTANNTQKITAIISATNSTPYAPGQTIDVQYNPDSPTDVRQTTLTRHTWGAIMLLISLFLIGASAVWYYIAHHYQFAAAAGGAASAFNMFRR
jgi:hypothetical protein